MEKSFFFQAEDGIRDYDVTGVQTCALPIFSVVETDVETTARATGSSEVVVVELLSPQPTISSRIILDKMRIWFSPVYRYIRSRPVYTKIGFNLNR